jgi:hypothetical protein
VLKTNKQIEKKRSIGVNNLYEQMIYEAELYVQHNWSDIAIHDRNKLSRLPVNYYCAWILSEFGSYLTPLWCNLSESNRWKKDSLAPIQILFGRWINKNNPLFENNHYMYRVGPHTQKCYLVAKTDDVGSGVLVPIDFNDLMDFCLIGKHRLNAK